MRLVTGGMTVHVLDMQETINAHTGGWGNFYIVFGYYGYMVSISRIQ